MLKENKDQIIEMLSSSLPLLVESVNNLVFYVQNKGKMNQEFLDKITDVLQVLKSAGNDHSTFMQKADESLKETLNMYYSGLELIHTGCIKALVIMLREYQMMEQIEKLGEIKNYSVYTAESAIEDLYSGSKIIINVVDRLFGS